MDAGGRTMLREFDNLSQERTGYRRLFTDDYFDLYLWYARQGGPLTGFQLCYDRNGDPHSLTCYRGKASVHSRIDDGEGKSGGRYKASPILVADGMLDKASLYKRFEEASRGMEEPIRALVLKAIAEHVN
jgi:hypothetical protein